MNSVGKILIRHGRVIDPANGIDQVCDIAIADKTILAIGEIPESFTPDQTINASHRIVCPGIVDLSARLREPGLEHKGDIASETRAAIRGGITTLCYPPDTNPVIDTPAVATLIIRTAQKARVARVLPYGAMTQGLAGQQLSEMHALKQAGCIAVSNGYAPLGNTLIERRALEYAATFGITAVLRPVDRHLKDNGCVHEGPVSTRLGLPGIPDAAESVAVARDVALAEHTDCHIHFRSLSSGTAMRILEQGQRNQLPLSADVAIHQLHLTEMDIEGFDSNCHVEPPLRSLTDRNTLRDGLARGVIGAICSDHQPHDPDAKEAPFPSTEAGISGLETLLPLTLKLVNEGVLSLNEAIARVTIGPAQIFGLPYGTLSAGASADICIFNPDRHWIVDPGQFASHGRNTPFAGWELVGKVTHTLFEGTLVFEEND